MPKHNSQISFKNFIKPAFNTIDPGTTYLHNWHIDLIANSLQKIMLGHTKRLIINIPPRSLKSIIVTVAWPAWLLGNKPTTKIIASSYSQALSYKHSLDCRTIINSNWYKSEFPNTIICKDQNTKSKFMTTQRGFRFATSIGGSVTGEGADILIVDDPHSPTQAASKSKRQHAITWFDQSFTTRLNNKKTGSIIVIMQRLHTNDLTGHLLNKQNSEWQHLRIPAISDSKRLYLINNKIIVRKPDHILHKEREGTKELNSIKIALGSHAYLAQYQQTPITTDEGMIKPSWFKRYTQPPHSSAYVQSWDTAIRTGSKNSYTVCTTWCKTTNGFYLLDMYRQQMEYPELKHNVINQADKWQPQTILIEDKASGQSLIQDLNNDTTLPVLAIRPTKDKLSRFAAITALIEAGRVWLPKQTSWLIDLETELLNFPHYTHDDIVDSISQYLNWQRNKSKPTSKHPNLRLINN